LKKELPELIEHARKDFDFGKVPGAVEYDARKIRKKASSAAFSPLAAAAVDTEDDETQASWKDYPPEKARRIFEWWKTRVGFFTYCPNRTSPGRPRPAFECLCGTGLLSSQTDP